MTWLDDPATLALALPIFALPLIAFAATWLKYVLPVFPGDGVLLLAFFLSGQGETDPFYVFLGAALGGLAGIALSFQIGRRYGTAALERFSTRRMRRLRVGERLRTLLNQHGERILLVNRFMPVVRHVMIYGAGAFGLRRAPSLLFANVSHLAFVAFLGALGLLTAGTWHEIRQGFQDLNRTVGLAVTAVVIAWLVWRSQATRWTQGPSAGAPDID
ncbi:MAG: VTT domain-containing protein [Acidobacteriota bacterium]